MSKEKDLVNNLILGIAIFYDQSDLSQGVALVKSLISKTSSSSLSTVRFSSSWSPTSILDLGCGMTTYTFES